MRWNVRGEVSELLERSPARQLAVQAIEHINLADIVIAGESFGQTAREGLGFLFGYRRYHGQPPHLPLHRRAAFGRDCLLRSLPLCR